MAKTREQIFEEHRSELTLSNAIAEAHYKIADVYDDLADSFLGKLRHSKKLAALDNIKITFQNLETKFPDYRIVSLTSNSKPHSWDLMTEHLITQLNPLLEEAKKITTNTKENTILALNTRLGAFATYIDILRENQRPAATAEASVAAAAAARDAGSAADAAAARNASPAAAHASWASSVRPVRPVPVPQNISDAQDVDPKSGKNFLHNLATAPETAPITTNTIREIMKLALDPALDPKLFNKIINAQDNEGCTPLYLAARHGNAPLVKILLELGANPNIPNKSQHTAYESALSRYGSTHHITQALKLAPQYYADNLQQETEYSKNPNNAILFSEAQQNMQEWLNGPAFKPHAIPTPGAGSRGI